MTDTIVRQPAVRTLAKYGLSLADWGKMVYSQASVCAVCHRLPKTNRLVIDHEHVRGWKKMTPASRKLYVRGLLCNRCNWQYLRRGMNAVMAASLCRYLAVYEKIVD